jgi:nicotinamide riboside transporter PnuC
MLGWIANLLQVVGLILVGRKNSLGWLFGIVAELLWILRAKEMNMADLMFISTLYIGVASYNFYRWNSND